jgi:hypothetical protein
MVLTGSFVISLVTGLIVTIIPENLASPELDASAGASGPHDFAVRDLRRSSKAHSRPPHPAPNVRDDRETPLFESAGWIDLEGVSTSQRNKNIFARRAGRPKSR